VSAYSEPLTVKIHNVVLLTVLSVAFLSATVMAGVILLPQGSYIDSIGSNRHTLSLGAFQLAVLAAAPIAYVWFCESLAGGQAKRWDTTRYALKLQLQAAIEAASLMFWIFVALCMVYAITGANGDTDTQRFMINSAEPGNVALVLYLCALSLPAVSMIVTAWRLHALAKSPGALVGAVKGTLYRKTLINQADSEDTHNALVRQLERLTRNDMPGLGRVMYGSHPKLSSRDGADGTVHELVWWSCPMKLLVSVHALADGGQEVRVRCVLREGVYRFYLLPTPADTVAQMAYIEAHLLQPLSAQLAKAAAERQRDALRDQAIAAQLRILQAQIEPHFLFNTLANVRQLYRSSVADGETMMDHLIAYLRCAMDELRAEHSSVVREMDLAMHFLSIMKIRMGERLSYQFSIPESLLQHPFPPAMLISLIENAIKHGLADCERGEITMLAARDGNVLRVSVADNGAGFSSVGGSGVGLSNIRQRLEAMYGDRAWLEVGAPATGGFSAAIVIPIEERNH
jgi:hypothetical protein